MILELSGQARGVAGFSARDFHLFGPAPGLATPPNG